MITPLPINSPNAVSLLGFGEAGAAFAKGWRSEHFDLIIKAYDLKTNSTAQDTAEKKWQDYAELSIDGGTTPAAVLSDAQIVFSLVTADQAHEAACTAAQHMQQHSIYFDCNSCAPETKRASASVLEAAGICYVDTAVMSPVHPKLHQAPLLVSGPHTAEAIRILTSMGMDAKSVQGDVGRASSVKMMRSIMIKGLEALTLECFLSARKAGVETEVLASLDASFPAWDWAKRGAYNLERSTSHGIRRAAEMREVAKTIADLGMNNGMSSAIVEWQQMMGDLNIPASDADLFSRADTIISAAAIHKNEEGIT
jgi:3-hydroxyisobutyrate dehydrogenase-like beta-hydroxyacid dehydrogenase